jgi:hypothetical protein
MTIPSYLQRTDMQYVFTALYSLYGNSSLNDLMAKVYGGRVGNVFMKTLPRIFLISGALALIAPQLRAETEAQQTADITTLKAEVAALQNQLAAVQTVNNAQNASVAAVQRQVNLIAVNPVLALGPYVSVNLATDPVSYLPGPNVVFNGVNVHIVDGSGSSTDAGRSQYSGLGNLVIGYNEHGSKPSFVGVHNLLMGTANTPEGACNLIVGSENHAFNSVGCVIFGEGNEATTYFSSILGGWNNSVGSETSVVVGGDDLNLNTLQDSVEAAALSWIPTPPYDGH